MNTKTLRNIAFLILILTLSLGVFAQDDSSSKTYKGTLAPGAEKTFKISAKIGQAINAKITSEKGNVLIAEEEGATELTMEVVDPNYELVIRNQGNKAEKYELKITVFTPEPEPAEDVSPEGGSRVRVYELTMYPYKFKRRFSVTLKKGGGARVSIEPKSAAERLNFTIVGQDDGVSPHATGFEFPFLIRADRDAAFIFELEKSDEVILEAKMKIEILTEKDFRDPQ